MQFCHDVFLYNIWFDDFQHSAIIVFSVCACAKLPRFLSAANFQIADYGIPTGPDGRFVLRSPRISEFTEGFTDTLWLFSDIKSVGPRDNAPHAVMSHNQITGSGFWNIVTEGVKNDVLPATGARATHPFHCSIPPLYVLSDMRIAPVINVTIKPLYSMVPTANGGGQPIEKITLATIPNRLLLTSGPQYLRHYPSLFFPGKDDRTKPANKSRARVDFQILTRIAAWRIREINMTTPEINAPMTTPMARTDANTCAGPRTTNP